MEIIEVQLAFNEMPNQAYPSNIHNAVDVSMYSFVHAKDLTMTISSARVLFYVVCGQDGTEGLDSISAAVVGDDAYVVLAGYSSGNWNGFAPGQADWAAIKLDADGNELWRWQVIQPNGIVLAGGIS